MPVGVFQERSVLPVISRLRLRVSILMAKLGVALLRRSGLFSDFFGHWRWALFRQAEAQGLHVLPVHYYSPVPDTAALSLDTETQRFLAADTQVLEKAVTDLRRYAERYGADFARIAARPAYAPGATVSEFRFGVAPYTTLEAELLYALIRDTRPARIIEIGCGHTTLLIAEAIRAEQTSGYAPDFVCIEPYRPDYLASLPPEVSQFHDVPLQSLPLSLFETLGPGDILFIDSSHVVRYGSDVVLQMTAILPRLRPGVLVHFHDIFLPYDYPDEWLRDAMFFWNEQYMLSALLEGNPRYRIRYPLHQLARERDSELAQHFPLLGSAGHRPGAYWIEVCDASAGR